MNKISKFAGVFVAVAFAVAVATPASALTSAQLADLLKGLGVSADVIAAVTAAQGGSTTTTTGTCGSFTKDLTLGSTGAEVVALQDFLVSKGNLTIPAGVSKGYFGAMTQSALAKYQTANGISPAAGYFGPMTRAKVSANCGTGTGTGTGNGTGTGTGDLQGGAGSISVSNTSQYSSEEVGEGEEEVAVLAFDVEADDDSDVAINSIKVEFVQGTAADSDKLDDYAQSVQVMFDGEVVGEADAEDFSENNDVYTKSISLDDVVIMAGEEERITVAVTALGNLDSGDIDTDAWTVDVLNVRFEDADGVVSTEDVDADSLEKTFDFTDFATASDVELKVALDDDTINDAHVLEVDDADDTTHEILSFTLEAKGDSDVWVDEIPVLITTTGETNESLIVNSANLLMDGEEIDSQDVSAGGQITFSDLDLTIDAGGEVAFTVEVELQDTNGALDNGDTVKAEITSASTTDIDAEDESGESLGSNELSGSALGDAHAAYDSGIDVKVLSKTADKTTGTDTTDDTGNYTIVFEVTAFGEDIYIFDDASTTAATSNTKFTVSNNSTVTSVSGVLARSDSNSTVDGTAGYKVAEDETAKFTLTIAATATTTSGFHNAMLDSVAWTASSTADTGEAYTFNLGVDAKTTDVNLIVR